MKFRVWFENVDKSIRRKFQRAVWKYLGVPSRITSFQVGQATDLADPSAAMLFGQPTGIAGQEGDITLLKGDEASGTHEILHQTGFKPKGISTFWNESITQIVAEDVGKMFNVPINPGYVKYVPYVRASLIPYVGDLREFARGYAKAPDKGQYVYNIWWPQIAQYFTNQEDWGQDTGKSFLQSLRGQISDFNVHVNYLAEIGIIRLP
jgi:hypothetical protein